METVLILELIAAAVVFVALATLLGYLGQKWIGVFVLGVSALVASTVSLGFTLAGFTLRGDTGAWFGLLAGIVLAWPLVAVALKLIDLIIGIEIKKSARRFMIWQWFGFCGLALFGHLAGGWIGLLTLTIPAIAFFWIGLYRTSAYILPLRHPSQRGQAFRSLVTFILGTNYPYYFVDKNGQLDKRVEGNPFLQFFAGPGIVYTDCSHGAYVSDSLSNNRVFEPGLNFTGAFDQPPRLIDLRPQLRTFTVEALTKDDITIKVEIFLHFKIETGHQAAKLGYPFPISKAVCLAVTSDLIERMGKPDKDKKHSWDDRLVCLIATPIVQDIISGYTVAELCGSANPRVKIAEETVEKMTNALKPLGLKVISGGIDNLIPQDKIAVEERLDNWRAEWERRNIQKQIGPDKHTYLLELERAKTEAELIKRLAKVARESSKSGSSLLLHLIDSLGEIMEP
jgi:hypothetical protein